MSEVHVVKPKQTLASIARAYDFADWRAIYDHPANAKLRAARPDPNLIHAGDKIFIPDKIETKHAMATDKTHQVKVKIPKQGQIYLRSVTILIHGVWTDGAWFRHIEAEIEKHQDTIWVEDDAVEHKLRYAVIPFSWGDYENELQGGMGHYAVDEVHQMFRNSWVGPDRIYQGHSAVRFKELIDELAKLGVPINVIAHSNGTAITCGALMLGTEIDNLIFMGSPLDADNERSQREIKRAMTHVSGSKNNFWSDADEWATVKGGIGAFGANSYYRKQNPGITNLKFRKGKTIEGIEIGQFVNHSDYMIAEHAPIFSAYVKRWAKDAGAPTVLYDEAKLDELTELADWTNVSYYEQKKNVTLESPEMKKYESQIKAILE